MRIFDYLSLFTLEHCHAFFFFILSEAGWRRQKERRSHAVLVYEILILSIALASFLYRTVYFWCGGKNFAADLSKAGAWAQRCTSEWSAAFLFHTHVGIDTVRILRCYLLQGYCVGVTKKEKDKAVHVVHLLLLSRNRKRHCYISKHSQRAMISLWLHCCICCLLHYAGVMDLDV